MWHEARVHDHASELLEGLASMGGLRAPPAEKMEVGRGEDVKLSVQVCPDLDQRWRSVVQNQNGKASWLERDGFGGGGRTAGADCPLLSTATVPLVLTSKSVFYESGTTRRA